MTIPLLGRRARLHRPSHGVRRRLLVRHAGVGAADDHGTARGAEAVEDVQIATSVDEGVEA